MTNLQSIRKKQVSQVQNSLLDKLNYLQCENERLKVSKLNYVKLQFISRQIISEIQHESKSKIQSLCNCQFTSSRRPNTSDNNKGEINQSQKKLVLYNDQQPQFKKIMDLFVIENQWLQDYLNRLENERDKALAECLINKQLAQQSQDNEQYVIIELSSKIKELNKQLMDQTAIQQLNINIQTPDKSYKPQLKNSHHIQIMKEIAIQLVIKNDVLLEQNNSLLVLNSVLGSELKKRQISNSGTQRDSHNKQQSGGKDEEVQMKMIDAQKKMLKLQNSPRNENSYLSYQSLVSEDIDFYVYSNRVQKNTHTAKPGLLPSLDIQKAQVVQQIQLKKQQDQQEKQDQQDKQKKIPNYQQSPNYSSPNQQVGSAFKQSDEGISQHNVDRSKDLNEQLQTDLINTKSELESCRLTLTKFQNLYSLEGVQNQILAEQVKQQNIYIDEILRTNEILIKAYQNQDIKIQYQNKILQMIYKNGKSDLKKLRRPEVNQDPDDSIFEEINDQEIESKERAKSEINLSYPIKKYLKLLVSGEKRSISQTFFNLLERQNPQNSPLKIKKHRQKSAQNHQSMDILSSSMNQTDDFDEFLNPQTNRTKLKDYIFSRENSKASDHQQ